MRFSKAVPLLILAIFALLTISNLHADPAKARRRRTPTPTPTGVAARPTAGAVRVTAPPAPAHTASPSPAPASVPTRPAAAPPSGPATADVEAGKVLYEKNCKKCHGVQGEGVARMYQLVNATIVHLGSKQAQQKGDDAIRKSVTQGFGAMEPVEDLSPQQVEKILAFVRTLKQ